MTKSWKTTVAGIAAILVAVGNAITNLVNGSPVDFPSIIAAIIAGIGLIFAKDGQVTGGRIQQ